MTSITPSTFQNNSPFSSKGKAARSRGRFDGKATQDKDPHAPGCGSRHGRTVRPLEDIHPFYAAGEAGTAYGHRTPRGLTFVVRADQSRYRNVLYEIEVLYRAPHRWKETTVVVVEVEN